MEQQQQPNPDSDTPASDPAQAAAAQGAQTDIDRTFADADQSAADRIAADADQTAADADQTDADADQTAADTDQRASDRDQVVADRAHADHPIGGEEDEVYESTRAERFKGTTERIATARSRWRTSNDRDDRAAARDETARLRDLSAAAGDRAADQRDVVDARAERQQGLANPAAEASRASAAEVRVRAAADRAFAAADRLAAAHDRQRAIEELQRAQLDALTGAFGRELGMVMLEQEMNRARHENEPLAFACIDVDGLKRVNDSEGHAAGDALLQAVVAAITAHLRSYDPIIRVGGDEFLCALADCTASDARRSFETIRVTLEQTHHGASISVGFAEMRAKDTLKQLLERGDADLYEAKRR